MNFEYNIGGKKYIQKPLVLGQIRQLMELMQGVVVANADALGIIAALGDKLPKAIAIALTPEGMAVKDKDFGILASEIEFEISPEMAIQAVEDFFSCNPIALLLERLSGAMKQIEKQITETKEIGLKKPASSSQAAILQKGIQSFGDIPQKSVSHI